MMNSISKIPAALALLLAFSSCNAQIKNAKTESVKIYGNCSMCEETIENAGNLKKVAQVDWNKDTKMATFIYDTTKTSQIEILKRIALAGYDSEVFLAPDDVYASLPECCQYERVNKTAIKKFNVKDEPTKQTDNTIPIPVQDVNQLKIFFDDYFNLKDAFVKSDPKVITSTSTILISSIMNVNMNKLTSEEHTVWMKVMGSLKSNADIISTSSNIEIQRKSFMDLSANIRDLFKVSKQESPVYYQHCPMYNDGKGANWLSKENAIKNPYYGAQMLTCGKTVEIIK